MQAVAEKFALKIEAPREHRSNEQGRALKIVHGIGAIISSRQNCAGVRRRHRQRGNDGGNFDVIGHFRFEGQNLAGFLTARRDDETAVNRGGDIVGMAFDVCGEAKNFWRFELNRAEPRACENPRDDCGGAGAESDADGDFTVDFDSRMRDFGAGVRSDAMNRASDKIRIVEWNALGFWAAIRNFQAGTTRRRDAKPQIEIERECGAIERTAEVRGSRGNDNGRAEIECGVAVDRCASGRSGHVQSPAAAAAGAPSSAR